MADGSLLNRLRELILEGDLAPGERVTEVALAEMLGVSRTPVRNALPALAAEGYLAPVGRRGYSVAAFSDEECLDALDLRALCEGAAAGRIARAGASIEVLEALESCLVEGDRIFASGRLQPQTKDLYAAMNDRFHRIVVDAAGSRLLKGFIERLNHVPFVSPAIIVFDHLDVSDVFAALFRAHGQHHAIVEAIRERDAARAEALFREHARGQRFSMFDRRGRT